MSLDTQPNRYFHFIPYDLNRAEEVLVLTLCREAGVDWASIASSLMRQSLQTWRWVMLVDANTIQEVTQAMAAINDPRIQIDMVDSSFGLACSVRVEATSAGYCCLLHSQTHIEPTFLEQSLWFLATHPQIASCTAQVTDGVKTWPYGFEQGNRFLERNYLSGTLVCKRDAYIASGGLDNAMPVEYADWDLVLKLARNQQWGYTIPEALITCQSLDALGLVEAANERVSTEVRQYVAREYGALIEQFPQIALPALRSYGAIDDHIPIANPLGKPAHVRRVLVLMPWLIVGGAERVNLNLFEYLTLHGYEISIATTLLNVQHNWVDAFAQYTSDIFLLDHFLHVSDFPRFLAYLIHSRKIDLIMVSNSYFGYQVLPYLRSCCPEVAIVDYCHSGDELWRNGGYPRCGAVYQQIMDFNIASSENVKQWMVERGALPERIEVAYTNVDVEYWKPDPLARQRVRSELGIRDEQVLIVFIGRLAGEKRPRMIAEIIAKLCERDPDMFRCLMIGDGPERGLLTETISRLQLNTTITILGRISDQAIRDNLAAADVFLLPSETEGISVAIFEAMAMGVIPMSARVGGQAELVTADCGFLIPRDSDELAEYVAALQKLSAEPLLRQQMQHNARQRVEQHFPLSGFGPHMAALFDKAILQHALNPPANVSTGMGREHAIQALELQRVERALDEVWADRERLRSQAPTHTLTTIGLIKQLVKRIGGPIYRWAVGHGMPWLVPARQRLTVLLRGLR